MAICRFVLCSVGSSINNLQSLEESPFAGSETDWEGNSSLSFQISIELRRVWDFRMKISVLACHLLPLTRDTSHISNDLYEIAWFWVYEPCFLAMQHCTSIGHMLIQNPNLILLLFNADLKVIIKFRKSINSSVHEWAFDFPLLFYDVRCPARAGPSGAPKICLICFAKQKTSSVSVALCSRYVCTITQWFCEFPRQQNSKMFVKQTACTWLDHTFVSASDFIRFCCHMDWLYKPCGHNISNRYWL